jgi:hypothetical protein
METVDLRPHHLLDIVRDYEPDTDPDYVRARGENGVRTVVRMLTKDIDFRARFVIGPDIICEPCSHQQPDGRCDRILERHDPPEPMDDYNDPLDARVLDYLGLEEGVEMTVREFLEAVNVRLPGVETVCTHPTEEEARRRDGLIRGMVALGIRT